METLAIVASIVSVLGIIGVGIWVGSISEKVKNGREAHVECRVELAGSLKEIYGCLKDNARDLNKIKGKLGINGD